MSIADSKELRIVFNILYSMIELIRRPDPTDTEECVKLRAALVEELGGTIFGKTILLHHLFELFMKYAGGSAPHYPLKKLLLLIWKVLLVSSSTLFSLGRCSNFLLRTYLSDWLTDWLINRLTVFSAHKINQINQANNCAWVEDGDEQVEMPFFSLKTAENKSRSKLKLFWISQHYWIKSWCQSNWKNQFLENKNPKTLSINIW